MPRKRVQIMNDEQSEAMETLAKVARCKKALSELVSAYPELIRRLETTEQFLERQERWARQDLQFTERKRQLSLFTEER